MATAIFDPAPLLPVTRLEANSGASRHVGSMILLPSDTYSDLLRYLAHMAQVAIDDVTPFLQRSTTKEIIRITGDMDLRREQPASLVVVVGLCAVCDKEVDGVPVEFHPCQLDEVIDAAGLRSKVGPIQRSATKEAVRIEGDEDVRRERPMGLVVVAGLCAACNKEADGVPVEFHPCRLDKVIDAAALGFRSPVGPIQRPPRGIVA